MTGRYWWSLWWVPHEAPASRRRPTPRLPWRRCWPRVLSHWPALLQATWSWLPSVPPTTPMLFPWVSNINWKPSTLAMTTLSSLAAPQIVYVTSCDTTNATQGSGEQYKYSKRLLLYGPVLTHWGRVTHICVCKLTIIDSDNGLSPGAKPLSEPMLECC